MTAACFGHGVYEPNSFAQCLSNLLSIGYGRFEVDLYWDEWRRVWSFCPAAIPAPSEVNTGSIVPVTVTATTQRTLTAGRASAREATQETASITARQLVETASKFTTTSSVDSSTIQTPSPSAPASPTTLASGITEYSLGPYTCSPDVDVQFLMQLMYSYLVSTDDTLRAQIKYLVFNIHASAPPGNPTSPALTPNASALPTQQELIGAQFNANLSSYLYTPMLLATQRANIVASWSNVDNSSRPDAAYFITTDNGNSSPDGWPSESYIEFAKGERLLLGVGTVDPQMSNTSLALDHGLIFSSDMVTSLRNVSYNSVGTLNDGCIFNPINNTVAAANSSNALATSLPDFALTASALSNISLPSHPITNLTGCGISYLLNSTLDNATADANPAPYLNFAVAAAIWSWASGEPLGDSDIPAQASDDTDGGDNGNDMNSPLDFRCAILETTGAGRWHTAFCQSSYLGACRDNSNPYAWSLTNDEPAHYMQLSDRCPSESSFAVPRTPLENAYLLQVARAAKQERVFLNFNSLDVESCWVAGANTTCPYTEPANANTVAVVVPTVAAIIILVLTIFVLLVKCGANRSASRKRRRGAAGWDYEGVPS